VFATSCLTGPAFVRHVGNRGSLVFGFFCMCFFCVAYTIASKFNETAWLDWGMLMLASAAVGFAASPIWVAQNTYLTKQALGWSAAEDKLNPPTEERKSDEIPMMGSANGMFWFCFQATQISGNVFASALLNAGVNNTVVFLGYLGFAGLGMLVSSRLRDDKQEQD